ncbi:MAG TPA: phosphotransferase family protein [Pyrinomonadaceae bacterium]|jgi:aminoglycoside phosphotransferase (APT) family kinase protein
MSLEDKARAESGDTAQVRPGEELDVSAIAAYVREHSKLLAQQSAHASEDEITVEQFRNGRSNLTYMIRFGGREEFVLRRPPFGPVAPTAHDMPREYRLLTAIHPFFPLAPRPLLLCEDPSVIGAPFYLMERRRGLVIGDRLPAEIGEDLQLRRRVSCAMIDTLAALHSVDIYSSGIVNIGKPEGFVTRQVKGWTERWRRSQTSEVPEMEEVTNWLAERIPAEAARGAATIVHNDFKLDNVMLDAGDPGRVIAVLDWEMSSVGDPLLDLGVFLCYWSEQSDSETRRGLSAVTAAPGWMTRRELIERYGAQTGRDLSGIAFYETFALFKVAVVVQQIYFRYVRGQTKDERFKDYDRYVAGLARTALELAQHL